MCNGSLRRQKSKVVKSGHAKFVLGRAQLTLCLTDGGGGFVSITTRRPIALRLAMSRKDNSKDEQGRGLNGIAPKLLEGGV